MPHFIFIKIRDERDFGFKTDKTRVVSRLVSSFETNCKNSQYQSQNLMLISKVSVSVSNFETTMQKFQSRYAICNCWSLSQHILIPSEKIQETPTPSTACPPSATWPSHSSGDVCSGSYKIVIFFSKSKFSVSVSFFETDNGLSLSLNFWHQRQKSQ